MTEPKTSTVTAVQKLIAGLEGWNFFVGDAYDKRIKIHWHPWQDSERGQLDTIQTVLQP